MGTSASVPQPAVAPAAVRRQRRGAREGSGPAPTPTPATTTSLTTLDEKNELRIEHARLESPERILFPTESSEHVDGAAVGKYVRQLLRDPKNRLGLSALSANNPKAILEKPSTIVKDTQLFNVKIAHEGSPVTNQRSSGRCWIFAACNVFRVAIMQKYNIKSFELSQAYLFFYDKVEKANYFLESVLDTFEEEVDSRLVSALNASPVGDGGQWDMIVNLVSKYGIVPQTLYPDSWNAQNSSVMDAIITTKLREDGVRLRALRAGSASEKEIAETKEYMLQDIIRILTLCLGPPPATDEKFTWSFYDGNNKLKNVSLTPIEFADTTQVKRFISLVNDPRNEYKRLLTVNHLGNVWGGRPITYVNVDQSVLKQACVQMLRKGLPVFFGSDVGKQSDSAKGIMDTELIDYELGFNIKLGLSKAERLLTGESQMTHAMVLTAVHLDSNDQPVRWRVENSWSDRAGTDGYFVMSDAWMDEFCYQAVVDPSVVSQDVIEILKQKPKVLPLWDPMGALA